MKSPKYVVNTESAFSNPFVNLTLNVATPTQF